jgi:integrase
MARKPNGEGTVFLRKDGRWQACLMVDGIRKVVYGHTEAGARKKLRALRQEADRFGMADPGKLTVAELLDKWMESPGREWRRSTAVETRRLCRTHILPRIGKVRLSRLTPARIRTTYTDLQAQGKMRTALKIFTVLHRACEMAVTEWHWLSHNPCDQLPRPTWRAPRNVIWAGWELARFMAEAADHDLFPLWALAIMTGARAGELLALTWEDVDWKRKTISIEHSLQRVGGEWVVDDPKSQSSNRILGLPPEGIALLKRQRAWQNEMRLKAGDK